MFAPLRVLPIPSAHPYPLRLRPEPGSEARVEHLPDPAIPHAPPGQWWPPPALDPSWVVRHRHEVDVVHLHFGFDANTAAELDQWCDTLSAARIPLVLTVHDIVNPHFVDQRDHLARLDVLVRRASAVLTLTEGAADAIESRWGRRPTVLAHPHVVPLDELDVAARRPAQDFVVGLHLKSLRANVVAADLVPVLTDVLSEIPRSRLAVHLHQEVLDPGHPRHDPGLQALLAASAAAGRLSLTIHTPHTDDELWAYLRSIDVSVMPYAFGTHSGWVEACHDLGTAVLAPRTGFWTEQQQCSTFGWPAGQSPNRDELAQAVQDLYESPPAAGATRAEREAQRRDLVSRHEEIYRRAAAELAPAGEASA